MSTELHTTLKGKKHQALLSAYAIACAKELSHPTRALWNESDGLKFYMQRIIERLQAIGVSCHVIPDPRQDPAQLDAKDPWEQSITYIEDDKCTEYGQAMIMNIGGTLLEGRAEIYVDREDPDEINGYQLGNSIHVNCYGEKHELNEQMEHQYSLFRLVDELEVHQPDRELQITLNLCGSSTDELISRLQHACTELSRALEDKLPEKLEFPHIKTQCQYIKTQGQDNRKER